MDAEKKPLTSAGQGQIESSDSNMRALRGALIFVCIVAAVFIGLFGWQTSRVNQTSSDSSGSVVDCSSCPCEPDCSTCPSDCNSCAAYTDPSQYCLGQGLGYDGSAWCEANMPAYTDPWEYCDSSGSELNCENVASKCPDIVLVSASACSDAGYYSCEAALVDCSSCASTNCDPAVVCASGYTPDDQCTPTVVCASGYIPDDECDTCCSPTVVCASGSGYIPDDQCDTCCASGSTVSSCTDISGCIVASDCATCCPGCAATADTPGYSMCTGTPDKSTKKYGICVCNPSYNPYCNQFNCPSYVGNGTDCTGAGGGKYCTYISSDNYQDNYCTQITPKTAGQMSQGMCNAYFGCEENACKGIAEVDTCACKASTNPNCSMHDCVSKDFKNCNSDTDSANYCIKLGPDDSDTVSQCNQADPRSCTAVPGCFNAGGFPYASILNSPSTFPASASWPTGFPQ